MPIIQNFGFMWERSEVAWGRPGPGGNARFEGRQVGKLKRVVDFQQQMGIYVLYDRFEQPVQVGQPSVRNFHGSVGLSISELRCVAM